MGAEQKLAGPRVSPRSSSNQRLENHISYSRWPVRNLKMIEPPHGLELRVLAAMIFREIMPTRISAVFAPMCLHFWGYIMAAICRVRFNARYFLDSWIVHQSKILDVLVGTEYTGTIPLILVLEPGCLGKFEALFVISINDCHQWFNHFFTP